MKLLKRYRPTGADPLFGNPERAHHGVAMEGYFWRITDPETGRVVIALCGANTGPRGRWSTLGLAAWPIGFCAQKLQKEPGPTRVGSVCVAGSRGQARRQHLKGIDTDSK